MVNGLDLYIDHLDGLIRKLSPAQRRGLMKDIAVSLRHNNKRRISANIEPEGGAMMARKTVPAEPLRKNARVRVGEVLQYRGHLVRMRTIKTAASASNPSRRTTKPHDADYVWGWDSEEGGIRKYRKTELGKPGGVRQKAMFRKLHLYKYLKQKIDANSAAVGFMHGLAAYIAAAHQEGEGSRPAVTLLGLFARGYEDNRRNRRAAFGGGGMTKRPSERFSDGLFL